MNCFDKIRFVTYALVLLIVAFILDPSDLTLAFKIGSGQSHSLCYGGTLGNGYFRTSQTRKDKRKSQAFTQNYVDRVRLAENPLQHYKCPARGSGWRHNKSISHLDLATSCQSAASEVDNWSHARQLRHSRSLDYNHLNRYKDALDIAEFYWRLDPEVDNCDERNEAHYREFNDADENYHSPNSNSQQHSTKATGVVAPLPQAFDFSSESCSLRRSRSLAVIREETFSDLQITSANNNRRRSQLIPRARLVSRGFFRERERLLCGNSQHHHHHFLSRENLSNSAGQDGTATYDSHQYQHARSHQPRHHHHHHDNHGEPSDSYYDNLKRLDAVSVNPASEQLPPWHNDKSDLESLNSDYFKNSLHQSQERKQQLGLEALEHAVILLASEKPRIYQSKRQPRSGISDRLHPTAQKRQGTTSVSGGESCPENSQSSLVPETTTSNSDDQTDSLSLSEQEYDITKVEQIFEQTQLDSDAESFELISLTRLETTEDDENESKADAADTTDSAENAKTLIAYDSVYLSSEEGSEATLIDESGATYDSSTLEEISADYLEAPSTLLHISIEDPTYVPQVQPTVQQKVIEDEPPLYTQVLEITHTADLAAIAPTAGVGKPKIFTVLEKRKLKRSADGTFLVKSNSNGVPDQSSNHPFAHLKRQATDSFYVPFKAHLDDNQYHSLPDVNIGQSLKVSECIDAELRSSYNLSKYQRAEHEKVDCRLNEATTKTRLILEKYNHKLKQREKVVTNEDIYDSIKKFGRAHQKARQKEYKEYKELQQEEDEKLKREATSQKEPKHQAEAPTTKDSEITKAHSNASDAIEAQPDASDYDESLKDASDIEAANFSKQIEKRAREIRESTKQLNGEQTTFTAATSPTENTATITKERTTNQFRIIVTDAHNNIIEEDSIDSNREAAAVRNAVKAVEDEQIMVTGPPAGAAFNEPKTAKYTGRVAAVKRTLSKSKRHQQLGCQHPNKASDISHSEPPAKSKQRRVLSSHIYKARPIRVLTSGNSFKMSRPQILHIRDDKQRAAAHPPQTDASHVESEYQKKVDAVRCYWSKLAAQAPRTADKSPLSESTSRQSAQKQPEPSRQFILGAQAAEAEEALRNSDFCSFMPSIEIVDLDGEKKATIVSAAPPEASPNDDSEPQFDHVRYKVLKSQQLIRSNILARNKREAQFDGLIQYLQDYSFQELLFNNNVVIVEPVRTKIERPLTTMNPGQAARPAKSTASQENAAAHSGVECKPARPVSGGIKRHFFYQPVRVNRELYEEELPNPDTVKNVRKFFEQHILPKPGQGILVQNTQHEPAPLSPQARRPRKYRYLTIDTSYGHAVCKPQQQAQQLHTRIWDTASVSSGISSGDLSSPCECNEPLDATPKKSKLTAEQLTGINVQNAVKLHNDNNHNNNGSSNLSNFKAESAKNVRARPYAVYGSSRDFALCRNVYEDVVAAEGNSALRARHNDDSDDDDVNGEDDEDTGNNDDDELCESYYVSNDILEKIRECGSSVTYYGGRVLENSDAAPLDGSNNRLAPNKSPATAMTLTRTRAMAIETSSAGQSAHIHQSDKQNGQNKSTPSNINIRDNEEYLGIKFKLVKSNSCSSRLELAGAGVDVEPSAPHKAVRKIVHEFECSARGQQAPSNDLLTINSQIPLPCYARAERRATQVTVHNHISVPVVEPEAELTKIACDSKENNNNEATDAPTAAPNTPAAKNLRLESNGQDTSVHANNGMTKVCRNKNVDLAFTMAKQQTKSFAAAPKDTGAKSSTELPSKFENTQQAAEELKTSKGPHVAASVTKTLQVAKPAAGLSKHIVAKNAAGRQEIERRNILPTPRTSQITVPVQIHQADEPPPPPYEERPGNLSTTSSTASLFEKAVGKHYVANDKSLLEKRKYDDIDFEEFEVYDPTKDFNKIIDEETSKPATVGQERSQHTTDISDLEDNIDFCDSLDEKL